MTGSHVYMHIMNCSNGRQNVTGCHIIKGDMYRKLYSSMRHVLHFLSPVTKTVATKISPLHLDDRKVPLKLLSRFAGSKSVPTNVSNMCKVIVHCSAGQVDPNIFVVREMITQHYNIMHTCSKSN